MSVNIYILDMCILYRTTLHLLLSNFLIKIIFKKPKVIGSFLGLSFSNECMKWIVSLLCCVTVVVGTTVYTVHVQGISHSLLPLLIKGDSLILMGRNSVAEIVSLGSRPRKNPRLWLARHFSPFAMFNTKDTFAHFLFTFLSFLTVLIIDLLLK